MKAKASFPLLFTAVIVVSISACLGGQPSSAPPTPSPPESAPASALVAPASPAPGAGTTQGGLTYDLSLALSSGGSYKCTYSYQGANYEILVKGNKYRSHAQIEGRTYTTISDGNWVYLWAEGASDGVKFNIEQMKKNAQKPEGYTDINEAAKTAANVNCQIQDNADGMFLPPDQVSFVDMSSLKNNACGACATLTDADQKAACTKSCGAAR